MKKMHWLRNWGGTANSKYVVCGAGVWRDGKRTRYTVAINLVTCKTCLNIYNIQVNKESPNHEYVGIRAFIKGVKDAMEDGGKSPDSRVELLIKNVCDWHSDVLTR